MARSSGDRSRGARAARARRGRGRGAWAESLRNRLECTLAVCERLVDRRERRLRLIARDERCQMAIVWGQECGVEFLVARRRSVTRQERQSHASATTRACPRASAASRERGDRPWPNAARRIRQLRQAELGVRPSGPTSTNSGSPNASRHAAISRRSSVPRRPSPGCPWPRRRGANLDRRRTNRTSGASPVLAPRQRFSLSDASSSLSSRS